MYYEIRLVDSESRKFITVFDYNLIPMVNDRIMMEDNKMFFVEERLLLIGTNRVVLSGKIL